MADTLAATGNKAVIGPLMKRLKYCQSQGLLFLIEMTKQFPSYVEYNDRVTAAVIDPKLLDRSTVMPGAV